MTEPRKCPKILINVLSSDRFKGTKITSCTGKALLMSSFNRTSQKRNRKIVEKYVFWRKLQRRNWNFDDYAKHNSKKKITHRFPVFPAPFFPRVFNFAYFFFLQSQESRKLARAKIRESKVVASGYRWVNGIVRLQTNYTVPIISENTN